MVTEKWADREFVLEAVKQHGGALRFAAEELRNDEELQKIATGQPEVAEAQKLSHE